LKIFWFLLLIFAPTFGVLEQEFDGNHKNFVWVVFTSVKQFFSIGFMGCLAWTWLRLLRSRPAHNVSYFSWAFWKSHATVPLLNICDFSFA
jgi:hypothetical protein